MGRLDFLEVENFKSYKGKQIIGPFYQFTAVIGPNGSGKSNLMDAISFVLGVRSQHLRSSNLKDLIYRGLVSSDAPEDLPSSAYVKAVYIKDNGQKLQFKRTITTAGTSEYFVNDKSVTYLQYDKFMESENILIKARNFLVFQGDVEAIASQSPKDLTKLIEQISGSLELKAEYEKLKALQDRTTEESTFNFNKKKGMAFELKHFEGQKQEAERYEKLKEDKMKIVTEQIVWQLFHTETKFQKIESELEMDDQEVASLAEKLGQDERQLQTSKADQGRCQLELKKLERQVRSKQSELDEKQPEILTAHERFDHSSAKVDSIRSNLSKFSATLDKQKVFSEQLKLDLDLSKDALKRHEAEAHHLQAQVLEAGDLEEYNELTHQLSLATFELKQELEHLERPEKLLSEQVDTTQQRVDQLKFKVAQLKDSAEEQTDRKAELEKSLVNSKNDVSEAEQELNTIVTERHRIDQQEKEANEKLTRILNELVQARIHEQISERERKLQEGLESLKRVFSGVYGRLVDLVKPAQQKFETAVLTVIGNNLDAVVVAQEATAFECIKFLRDQRLGSAKFIPLDTIATTTIQNNLRNFDGARLAIDVIQYDPKFERAIHYACGNALICDTFEASKEICFNMSHDVKAVSLDGTVIHRSGLITGGGATVASAVKAVRHWEEKKIYELKQQRDQLLADLNELQKSKRRGNIEEELNSKLQGLRANIAFLEDELSINNRNLDSNSEELSLTENQLKKAEKQLLELNISLEDAKTKSDFIRRQINAEQDKLFVNLCIRLKIPNIRQYEEGQLRATRLMNERNMKFQTAISKLENQLIFENRRLEEAQQRVDQLSASLSIEEKNLDAARSTKKLILAQCEALQKVIRDLSDKLNESQEKLKAATNLVQICQRARDHTRQALDSKNKYVLAKEALLTKLSGDRLLILRRCKLEEIPLNLNMGSLDNFQDEEYSEALTGENSYSRMSSDNWSVQINYKELSRELRTDGSEDRNQLFEANIQTITDEMDKMAPNMKAIERMGEIRKRALKTEKEFSNARAMATDAKNRFNEVKLKRYKLFYNAFDHISREINEIYKSLTKNTSFPMGGTAYLSLENNEEPYLAGIKYHAMPPMKRFGDIEKLSGGEKSVAALALLFAVHSFKPSPFFVLDEVDAALDNDNVAKVARYLRQSCAPEHNTQFLVISLKSPLYERAHSLVGVCRDQTTNSSKILTLDLEQYDSRG